MEHSDVLPNDVLVNTPHGLPVPEDDGACGHLIGTLVPNIELRSTAGQLRNVAKEQGWLVLYCYPMTGRPGIPIPDGWASIPGAAGCTPQSCSFRDNHVRFRSLGITVFGMSAQTSEDQIEASERLHLPYELISDSELLFANALGLPTFEAAGKRLLKRVTLVIKDGTILKYFYPVFPPERNADDVFSWCEKNAI